MRKSLLFAAVLMVLLVGLSFAADKIGPRPENLPLLTGYEPLPDVPYSPSPPGLITDSPGELVGTTQYDYQSNGSSGRRIVVDSQGGVHFAWMNGVSYPSLREIDYNYVDAQGNWLVPESGVTVSQQNGAGYVQLGLTSDNKGVVAYHQWNLADYSVIAVDNFPGMGIFSYFDPPDMLTLRCYWPYIAVDRNDRFHVLVNEQVANAGDPGTMGYTRSLDGGATWTSLSRVDTLMTLSNVIVASPVSDKVAIVYTHPLDFETQWRNSIYYIESQDGTSWNFRVKNDVTEYGTGGDSLFAYIDLDAIYDYDDNLHIIWNAQWVTDEGIYYKTFLFHWSSGSGAITEMAASDSLWISGCDYGVWNRAITKMSLGIDQSSDIIYAAYTAFDTTDCSAGGYANGDIYIQGSVDGGQSWWEPQNITNSPSPGCQPGECDSDHWSSMADKVDGFLRIVYINDKDAGGIPQTEGTATDNPVLYFSDAVTSVDEKVDLPLDFTLAQNYPNPFNAETKIGFKLERETNVRLAVYSLMGAEVAVLHDGMLEAGVHDARWSADGVASGVYYYKLSTEAGALVKKMTLLK